MYDVSSRASFERLEPWLQELSTYSTKTNITKMLVGNKIDKVRRCLGTAIQSASILALNDADHVWRYENDFVVSW